MDYSLWSKSKSFCNGMILQTIDYGYGLKCLIDRNWLTGTTLQNHTFHGQETLMNRKKASVSFSDEDYRWLENSVIEIGNAS